MWGTGSVLVRCLVEPEWVDGDLCGRPCRNASRLSSLAAILKAAGSRARCRDGGLGWEADKRSRVPGWDSLVHSEERKQQLMATKELVRSWPYFCRSLRFAPH